MEIAHKVFDDDIQNLRSLIEESISAKKDIMCDEQQLQNLVLMAHQISDAIKNGGKLLICGNGGSAADAQHLAAELLVRLRPNVNREGIPALALAMDSSTFSACGNDFSFEHLYERMVTTFGKPGDALLGISTSGNSKNVNLAFQAAKKNNMHAFAFLGAGGGEASAYCDRAFTVPSKATGRIQESHIMAGHALMEMVEDRLIKDGFIQLNLNFPFK